MTPREITLHRSNVEVAAGSPRIYTIGEPTIANAINEYEIILTDATLEEASQDVDSLLVAFQNGPVPENGINGGTIEGYLAICADRLEGFQAGKFPCEENAEALKHIYAALEALHSRTRARQARGVEGKMSA